MPLNLSAAHSSRIPNKPYNKSPLLKRAYSSPFADLRQRKPLQRSRSKPENPGNGNNGDHLEGRLEDVGIIKSLATDLSLREVAQTIQYIRSHMFDAVPEAGGFNSTKIAEILNFRRSLPPTVTVGHIHVMVESPTRTEREIAELMRAGMLRKVVTPGRGKGGSSLWEGLILSKDVERLVRETKALEQDLMNKFLDHLRRRPMTQSISSGAFSSPEITALMRAGFLTFSAQHVYSADALSLPESSSQGTMASISSISRAASGSVAAVGGEDLIYRAGGRGGIRRSSSQLGNHIEWGFRNTVGEEEELKLSLPGTGPYLKLLNAACSYMVSLVMKSKFRELPKYLLQERWHGGISTAGPAGESKKYRGESAGVLPNRTRKWIQFYGLSFDWVLAECLGAGLVEVFETGSVGQAVRIP